MMGLKKKRLDHWTSGSSGLEWCAVLLQGVVLVVCKVAGFCGRVARSLVGVVDSWGRGVGERLDSGGEGAGL